MARPITRAREKEKTGKTAAIAVTAAFVALCAASYLLQDNVGQGAAGTPLDSATVAVRTWRPHVTVPVADVYGAPTDDSVPAIMPFLASSGGYEPESLAMKTLLPSLRFAERVNSFLDSPASDVESQGRRFLKSKNAEDRALGGVLLFLSNALDGRLAEALAADKDPLVALTVLDWVRDMGSDEEIQIFTKAVSGRGFSDAELLSYVEGSGEKAGGGRSALDILLKRQDEDAVADAIGPVVLARGASLDAREQVMFKLLEPENVSYGKELMLRLADEGKSDPAFAAMVAKWRAFSELEPPRDNDGEEAEVEALADNGENEGGADEGEDGNEDEEPEVDYKVWDGTVNASAFFSSAGCAELGVRTLANYLEYVLRRDDPYFEPVVEEGVCNVAMGFLNSIDPASLSPLDAATLPRLSANIERLKEYDPAFAPDDELDPDDDPDEEIDEETLNEEDEYLAEMMRGDEVEDNEGEDEDDSPNDGDMVDDGIFEDEEESDDEGSAASRRSFNDIHSTYSPYVRTLPPPRGLEVLRGRPPLLFGLIPKSSDDVQLFDFWNFFQRRLRDSSWASLSAPIPPVDPSSPVRRLFAQNTRQNRSLAASSIHLESLTTVMREELGKLESAHRKKFKIIS